MQPNPIQNAHPYIWELVIQDMKQRNELGIERYGTPLQPYNGRKSLQDAYEEVLDLAAYIKQALYEKDCRDQAGLATDRNMNDCATQLRTMYDALKRISDGVGDPKMIANFALTIADKYNDGYKNKE